MIGNMAQKMVMEVLNEDDKTVWFDGVLLPRYTIKIVNVKQTSITICQTTVDLHPLFKELNKRGIVHESMANDLSRHLKQFLWSEWSKIGNSSTHHDEDSRRIIIKSTITGGCASLKEFIIQFFKEKTKYENSVLVKKHSGRLRVILKADSESLSNDRRNLKHTVLLWNTSPLQIWKDWIQQNWERTSPKGWRVWTFLTVLI